MTQPGTWSTKLTATDAPAAVILIRLYVGAVFLFEGILKFLRPDALGTGRFDKAGIPAPGFFAPLDGVFEIACGLLILVGLLTRLAAIPMIVDMVGALLITKLPILWGNAPCSRTSPAGGTSSTNSAPIWPSCAAASSCSSSAPAPTRWTLAWAERPRPQPLRLELRAADRRANLYRASSPRTSRASSLSASRSSARACFPASVAR